MTMHDLPLPRSLFPLARTALVILALIGAAWATAVSAGPNFDVRTFRPWAGYAMPNGVWLTADLNGDGKKDLVHVVNGADYVHTWMSKGDGTFNVGTFRPWAGYAMPNGVWLVADINGDGRDDLVHVVNGADYVHTWTSNGDGTFRVGTFRPWTGYAMPNGVWLVADLNGDGRKDLVHVVNGADYVHTWTSNGDGTFRVGTFRPWAGYAMPNGVWLVADLNGDRRGDLVHVVNGADYVHTWMSRGDGTFTVGTFRPWAGYAMPNGVWLVGDLNGDNRGDLVHVVNGADYVHTWMSRGDGTFTVGTFRPWAGYAMPNGVWLAADFNRDGRADLVHAVAGTDYVHTWTSRGDGTFSVGTFAPWAGYAIPNGLWLAGDITGGGKSDIVHVVAGTDYVHPWLSTWPGPNDVRVDAIEVTQAIQDMTHSVPLIASKPTVVRVYLNSIDGPLNNVSGKLAVQRDGGSVRLVNATNTTSIDPSLTLRQRREDTQRSLNFLLPADMLAAGGLTVRLASVADAGGAALGCADCTVTSRHVTLDPVVTMRLRTLGLRYSAGSPVRTLQPRPLDFNLLRSWLTRAYPIGALTMTTTTIGATAPVPFNCNDANAQLTTVRALDVAGGTDRRTHYYGYVMDDGAGNGSFFMRGCAAIPGTPNPAAIGSGPTGPATWGWDTDGSYGDWYGGHELGHTYGRFHIGSGCGETADDPSYPYPIGQISGNDGAFVGFDSGDPAFAIQMRALPGTVWRDVMSYCANQWISNYTYQAIMQRLRAENGLPAGPEPPPMAGPVPMAAAPPSAPAAYTIATSDAIPPVSEARSDVPSLMLAPAFHAPGLVAAAGTAPTIPVPAYAAAPERIVGAAQAKPVEAQAVMAQGPQPPNVPAPAPAMRMIEADQIAVVGTANLTRNAGQISYVRRVQRALVPQLAGPTDVRLRTIDRNGREIGVYPVAFRPSSERELGEDLLGVFEGVLPPQPDLKTIELLVHNAVAARYDAPEGARLDTTEVRVAAQPQGLAVSDEAPSLLRLEWGSTSTPALTDAVQPGGRGEKVTYDVQASRDAGRTWQTLAVNVPTPTADIDVSEFKDDPRIDVRVVANVGFESKVIAQRTITK